ncbi:MAG: hypothetical protein ABIG39_07800 [Candidatus Micrarchaeota archaeon]
MTVELQPEFDKTAKILFGEEIGKLSDFEEYLKEVMMPYMVQKSVISGKDVMISTPYYSKDAKFISQDEMGSLKSEPLDINEIKDIDSLFQAIGERTLYCGNKVFGKNYEVEDVDNCVDCFKVSDSQNVYEVKYGAYTSSTRESEYVFGVMGFPKSKFSMRTMWGLGANRCFETYYGNDLSDTYYVFNCVGCQNCMFSSDLRGKRNMIGNLELAADRYSKLKKKLLSEIACELKKKKRIFSIADITLHGRDKSNIPEEKKSYDNPVPRKVEKAFGATTNLLFGKKHLNIRDYGPWLLRYAMKIKKIKGALGTPTYKFADLPIVNEIPADRIVTLEEGMKLALEHINISEDEEPGLKEILERVSKTMYFSFEFDDGHNENCVDTPARFTGTNIYEVLDTTRSKNSAYSTAVVESEHIFGGYLRLLKCRFCINCYDSTNLKGCFEVDSSYSSRDSYFCHNCENVHDAMFCFNVKNKEYAIGNEEVGREEYLRVRKILLDYINKELEEKKSLEMGIFRIPKKR